LKLSWRLSLKMQLFRSQARPRVRRCIVRKLDGNLRLEKED
jgi:hypothetical protein